MTKLTSPPAYTFFTLTLRKLSIVLGEGKYFINSSPCPIKKKNNNFNKKGQKKYKLVKQYVQRQTFHSLFLSKIIY